jgi:selenoprotein W-related protein
LAAAIKKACGVETKLIEGSGGVFDVKADGKLVFSKHETGRFPEDAEILDMLAPHRA